MIFKKPLGDVLKNSQKAKPDTLPISSRHQQFNSELLMRLSLEWAEKAAKDLGVRLLK